MSGSDFAFHARHTHDTKDFLFEIDEYRRDEGDQLLLAHIRVLKFSKDVLKEMLRHWRVLRSFVTAPIFVSPQDDDEKWVKFVTLMGFKPFQQILCNDGASRPLYIHTT